MKRAAPSSREPRRTTAASNSSKLSAKTSHRDIERAQKRRAAFAAFGDRQIEVRNPTPTIELGVEFELQPFLSRETGAELARRVDAELKHLEAELTWREKEAKKLLADKR